MKIFISWSGTTSHGVAKVLRDWLPSVIQVVEPYVSSEDIDKGTRWSTDIAGELHASSYGIICLTKDNLNAPWINFEAGALGKSVDKSRVSPFLFDLKRSEVNGPILQFQSTLPEKTDVLKLLQSINNACEKDCLDDIRLSKTFEVWWPRLEDELKKVKDGIPLNPPMPETKKIKDEPLSAKVLEELLELTRNNHKILRDPSSLLPPEYISGVMMRATDMQDRETRIMTSKAAADVATYTQDALSYLEELKKESPEPSALLMAAIDSLTVLRTPIRYLSGGLHNPGSARTLSKIMRSKL
ncbi:MAG: TIR domain-containing protein [Burkholderiaceae bacterium]